MNATLNDTENILDNFSLQARSAAIPLYTLSAVLILVCNSFTFYCLQTCKGAFYENTRIFFQALTFVDVLGGLIGYSIDVSVMTSDDTALGFTGVFCLFLPTLYYSVFNQTLAIICCINVDRFLMVTCPLRYPIIVTHRRVKLALLLALGLPLLSVVPLWPVTGFPFTASHRVICGMKASGNESLTITKVTSVSLFVPGLVTIVVTAITNVSLVYISCRHTLRIKHLERSNEVGALQKGRSILRALRTVVFITGFCYLGLGIWLFSILYVYPRMASREYELAFIIGGVVELSSRWWNCVVYVLTNRSFRTHAITILKRLPTCQD